MTTAAYKTAAYKRRSGTNGSRATKDIEACVVDDDCVTDRQTDGQTELLVAH